MPDKFCVNCQHYVHKNKNPPEVYFCKKAHEKHKPEICAVTGKTTSAPNVYSCFWQRSPIKLSEDEQTCGPDGDWFEAKEETS